MDDVDTFYSIEEAEPRDDRLVVKPIVVDELVRAGIVLLQLRDDPATMGIVIKAGPGRMSEYGHRFWQRYWPGDHLLFGKYTCTPITAGTEEYIVISGQDVMLRLRQGEETKRRLSFSAEHAKRFAALLNPEEAQRRSVLSTVNGVPRQVPRQQMSEGRFGGCVVKARLRNALLIAR